MYDRLGVAVPANWQTTTIDRRRLPPCFSGGVVTVPHAMFDQLRSFWLECIGRMEPQAQAVLERFPRLRMPAPALFAWLGLSLAIAGSGLPWDYLPREMDCPASYFTKIRQFDPDPVICRYVPEPPGSRIGNWVHHCQPHLDSRLQRGIDRLNARLYEERELPGHEWERETLLGEPYGLRPTWNGAADRTARGDEPAPPDDDLRIMIAATPRTGNNWLTQLLSKMYDLPLLPGTEDADALERIDDPRFVFYSHFQPTAAVLRWAQRWRVTVVTLTRNPADVFLSLYEFINAMHRNKLGEQITSRPVYQKLIGNALDSEEVYHHLQHHFDEIQTSVLWILSGKARVVRYEELNQRPEAVLAELCDRIRPVPPERIREIVEACSKEKMRRQGLFMEVIVRRGAVGEGLQRLTPRHLQCIREKYADELAILGYSL